MITMTHVDGLTGSNKKHETFRQDMARAFALTTLKHELSMGFKPIELKRNKIIIERLSQNFSRTEYRTYLGPCAEMKSLVSLARAQKMA